MKNNRYILSIMCSCQNKAAGMGVYYRVNNGEKGINEGVHFWEKGGVFYLNRQKKAFVRELKYPKSEIKKQNAYTY